LSKHVPPTEPDPDFDERNDRSSPLYSSEELFKGHRTIRIRHRSATYRLIITRQSKLILNK